MRKAHACIRYDLFELARNLFDRFDFVVQKIHLAAARQLALTGFADLHIGPLANKGLDGVAMRGRGGNNRQITQAREAHVQRARDWRGGQGQDVDL